MRITTDIFVSAILRKISADGGFGTVLKKGALEAGTVHFFLRRNDGRYEHLAPASQLFYDVSDQSERLFERRDVTLSETDIRETIEREERFDSDIWAVEIEGGTHDLPIKIIEEDTP